MNARAKSSAASRACGHLHVGDLHGVGRLVLHALDSIIDGIEAAHLRLSGAEPPPQRSGAAFVYRRARAGTAIGARLIDATLAPAPGAPAPISSREREAVLAALNGLVGDLLERIENPLAIRMCLRRDGKALRLEREALAAALPAPSGKLLVLMHGLCRCDLQWLRRNHDHGAALARDLGYTPVYLQYNSGLHVSTNGQVCAELLEQLLGAWPVAVDEIAILAHSMGGLVARSACHYARARRRAWPRYLAHMVFLGTPHHGAPLERHGNWLGAVLGRSRWTAQLARLGELRSAGITDLRYGSLLDQDWHSHDRFEHRGDTRRHIALPRGVKCYAIAGSTGRRSGDLRDRLLGDGLIPVDTALGRHADPARTLKFPASRQWVAFETHHLDLLSRVEVYERIRDWLQ